MYQYKYQGLQPAETPFFTCVVPAKWLQKKLPTMGGCVGYVGNREPLDVLAKDVLVYRFTDAASTTQSSRIVPVELLSDGKKLLDKPAKIHCQAIEVGSESDEWCVEVLLLNHFFGNCALTALFGNISLDHADIVTMLEMSSEFDFKYGVGETPSDILPTILIRDAKSCFGEIFCNQNKMRSAYLRELSTAMNQSCAEDGLSMATDIAVDQEQMLISVLSGR